MPTKVMGCDISMNHGAVVELTDGEISGWWYYTDIAGAAKRAPDIATRWIPPKTKDKHIIQMTRLAFFERWFGNVVLKPNRPDFMGIEDYALDAGRNAQHTGEVGGAARILAWFTGVKLRLHDPMSIKLFVAHHGHADKAMIEKAVAERWGQTFGKYNGPAPKGKKANRTTSEDLCDAYGIARMIWAEVQLRRGEAQLSDFHEQEIRVFNRVTKFMPMSLLDRDWIINQEAADLAIAAPGNPPTTTPKKGAVLCTNPACFSDDVRTERDGVNKPILIVCNECDCARAATSDELQKMRRKKTKVKA